MASTIGIEREQLIAALRLRYDHYSAEAVLGAALARAGLAEAAAYDAAQVQALRGALARVGDRLGAVNARLDELLGGAPAVAPPVAVAVAVAVAVPVPVPETVKEPETVAVTVAEPETVAVAVTAAVAVAVTEPEPLGEVESTTTIALTKEPVDDGAEVLVCGGFPALGEWDVSRALPMARSGDHWIASFLVAPGTELAVKFLERRPDGEVVWEGGDNHTFIAAPRVEAVWR